MSESVLCPVLIGRANELALLEELLRQAADGTGPSANARRPSRPGVDNEAGLRTYKVDLHGHDVLTAVDLAQDRVHEAYQNGYEAVELLHGAGDVTEPVETGRGRIKWALRKLVEEGRLDGYIDRGRTWLKAGSILLYLKRNPQARPESWSPDPPRSHR